MNNCETHCVLNLITYLAMDSIHSHRLATGSSNRTHLSNLTPKFLNDPELGHSEVNYLGLQPESPAQILKPPYHPGLQVSVHGQNDISNYYKTKLNNKIKLQSNNFVFLSNASEFRKYKSDGDTYAGKSHRDSWCRSEQHCKFDRCHHSQSRTSESCPSFVR